MTTAKAVFSRTGGFSTIHYAYRSGLEDNISMQLDDSGVVYDYEKFYLEYEIPAKKHKYIPDFILPNNIIIEAKGILDLDTRKKMLYIKEQYPWLDIRFVFSNSKAKINPKSKTTYADWCIKNKFKYADKYIPREWIEEEPPKSREGLIKKG